MVQQCRSRGRCYHLPAINFVHLHQRASATVVTNKYVSDLTLARYHVLLTDLSFVYTLETLKLPQISSRYVGCTVVSPHWRRWWCDERVTKACRWEERWKEISFTENLIWFFSLSISLSHSLFLCIFSGVNGKMCVVRRKKKFISTCI
jgi:hypothetical protein